MYNENANCEAGRTFTISVSKERYATKPEKPAFITFNTQEVSIDDLERYAKEGRSFCYNFNTQRPGFITQKDRHKENFASTSIIFFDMDKMFVPMDDYIAGLPYKPTLAYTTYSNGKNGRYGYRLLYLFDNYFTDSESFDRFYDAIANANGFVEKVDSNGVKYGFDKRPVNQQYYGGGDGCMTYKSYETYSYDDFIEFAEPS